MKNPCAYCGATAVDRTRGHVFSKNLYPKSLSDVKRILVPECLNCKARWEDADPHFRNVVLAAWHPEKHPEDSRYEKMRRSFSHCDGTRRLRDLTQCMREFQIEGKVRRKIYPMEDLKFVLVLKRIIRGLCHHHDLGTAIPDTRVTCDVLRYMIPEGIEREMDWNVIADSFIRYSYLEWVNEEASSTWILEIGTQMQFIAWIHSSPNKTIQADAFGAANF